MYLFSAGPCGSVNAKILIRTLADLLLAMCGPVQDCNLVINRVFNFKFYLRVRAALFVIFQIKLQGRAARHLLMRSRPGLCLLFLAVYKIPEEL
jgi:hypothetical protein